MKIFEKGKDGGHASTVTGYWLIESKKLFSIVLLKFEGKSRPVYHNHAFHCFSWILKGELYEHHYSGFGECRAASWKPFITKKTTFHKVDSKTPCTWVLSFRGPWEKTWREWTYAKGFTTLTDGRKYVS
jgi:hypothetical protein